MYIDVYIYVYIYHILYIQAAYKSPWFNSQVVAIQIYTDICMYIAFRLGSSSLFPGFHAQQDEREVWVSRSKMMGQCAQAA